MSRPGIPGVIPYGFPDNWSLSFLRLPGRLVVIARRLELTMHMVHDDKAVLWRLTKMRNGEIVDERMTPLPTDTQRELERRRREQRRRAATGAR